jgi:hypothetical protein
MLIPSGFMKSSLRISPGWIRSSSFVVLAMVSSVIVHDFHIMGLASPPRKANSPLIIDPNAVLVSTVCLERFEAIARRNSKILQTPDSMEIEKFAARHAFDSPEPRYGLIVKESLAVPTSKRADHDSAYYAQGIPSSRMAMRTRERLAGVGLSALRKCDKSQEVVTADINIHNVHVTQSTSVDVAELRNLEHVPKYTVS